MSDDKKEKLSRSQVGAINQLYKPIRRSETKLIKENNAQSLITELPGDTVRYALFDVFFMIHLFNGLI